jgi:streptogramin lyase
VLDPERGEGPTLELDAPASAIAACAPGCAHALLYAPGSGAVTLVDVARSAAGDDTAVRALQLPAALAGVSVVEHRPGTGPYALGRHAAGGATWFDLDEGALHSVALDAAQTQSAQIGQDGGLWIATPGGELVTRIDPVSGERFEVQLDAPLARLLLVPEAELAVAIHLGQPGDALALSVLPSAAPAPADVVFVEDLP